MTHEESEYQVSIEPLSETAKNFRAEVKREIYNKRFDKQLRQMAQSVELKGFRKGKAPLPFVKQMYGDRIHNTLLDTFFREALDRAVTTNSIEMVGIEHVHADFFSVEGGEKKEDKEKGDVHFHAHIAILPRPKIDDYRGLSYDVEVESVSEEGFDKVMHGLRDSLGKVEPVEGRTKVQTGDLVVVSYTMEVDGELLRDKDGNERQRDSCTVGENRWLPELEAGVLDAEIGVEKEIRVSHPEEYADNRRAGKEAIYRLTAEKIFQKILPELDDELAKQTGIAETVDELKTKIRANYEKNVARENRTRHRTALIKVLLEKNAFDVPKIMLDEEIRQMLFEQQILDPKDERSYSIPLDSVRDRFADEATFRVRRGIALRQIAEQEKMDEVEDKDCEGWFSEEAEREGITPQELKTRLRYPQSRDDIEMVVRFDRVMKFLQETAKSSEKVSTGDAEKKDGAPSKAKKKKG
ncbi:MAG: trigger factor [Deltaproteobacteria bacterium]|nr:trigger factor [Deltaproteobacteria bacterium]